MLSGFECHYDILLQLISQENDVRLDEQVYRRLISQRVLFRNKERKKKYNNKKEKGRKKKKYILSRR